MNSTDLREQNHKELAELYFSMGFQQKEIIDFLRVLHGKVISPRTLKRLLSQSKLFRRKNYSKIEDIVKFIEYELTKSGQLHGYKWMHLRCLQNNFVVTQHIVRDILKLLDPDGVELRRKKRLRRRQYYNEGPNYLWHVDSYDKLKPYGICINACIDGFSRHIIWLKAGLTTSDPKVVGGHFLNAIKLIGGCPVTVRCDLGTENGTIEKIQNTLHELFNTVPTNRPPFLYGKSMHNQRIESWWAILRKHGTQYWMNVFQMLKENNDFDGSFLDKSLIQFCFTPLIQEELDQISLEWNVHRIRKTRNAIAPSGRPAVMYEVPDLYGAREHLVPVPSFAIETLSSECTFIKTPCDEDFYDLCRMEMEENGLTRSPDPYQTVDLYLNLRNKMKSLFS